MVSFRMLSFRMLSFRMLSFRMVSFRRMVSLFRINEFVEIEEKILFTKYYSP